jgi:DNA-binding CsgD family transcriptional regulator
MLIEGCLVELAEHKREILNHRFCYSNKTEMLTAKEMAIKLGITREAVYAAENTLERKIGDIIKKFKVLALRISAPRAPRNIC